MAAVPGAGPVCCSSKYGTQSLPWLLAACTASVRYLTLRGLLSRPKEDAEVQAMRRKLAASGTIPAILAGQTDRWATLHAAVILDAAGISL